MSNDIHKRLPLLDYVLENLALVDLENVLIISVQHLLTTTFALFQSFFKRGLKKENLFVLGKCYSTDLRVFDALKNQGVYVDSGSIEYDSHEAYDILFDQLVDRFTLSIFNNLPLERYEKIIILDDGGHLIQRVHAIVHSLPRNIIAIEQTSSGYHRIKNLPLKFPVINLASSWAKLEYESPLIVDKILRFLKGYFEDNISKGCPILILGNGVLGSAIKRSLENVFPVIAYDIDPLKSMVSKEELPLHIQKGKYIIGCSGDTSLSKSLHQYLQPSTTLVSISSTDREFDGVHLRKKLQRSFSCHENLVVDDIRLLNSGFPINFSDEYSSADSEDFQLTRALILGAVVQAVTTNPDLHGIQDFWLDMQKKIIAKFLELKEPQLSYAR